MNQTSLDSPTFFSFQCRGLKITFHEGKGSLQILATMLYHTSKRISRQNLHTAREQRSCWRSQQPLVGTRVSAESNKASIIRQAVQGTLIPFDHKQREDRAAGFQNAEERHPLGQLAWAEQIASETP